MEFQPLIFFDIFLDGTASRSTIPSSAKTGLHAYRHPLSRVPAFASIALRQRLRRPSNRAYVPKKIHPWIFFGSEICKANLRGAKPPIHGLGNFYQVRKIPPGFFGDCRIATQFCMLLSRPSLDSFILFKYEKSHTLKKINFFYAFMSNSKLLPSIYYMEVKTNEIHKQKVQRFRLHRLVRK